MADAVEAQPDVLNASHPQAQTADPIKYVLQKRFPFDGEKKPKGRYLLPKVVCSSVHNPETKKMVEMS